ncbi:AvrD family protein [Streptomyces sp. NPDC054956]
MTTATPLPPLSLGSVDEFLGAREKRFFGEGFKRVTHSLTDIRVAPDEDGGLIEATAGLHIPGGWSTKGETSQRPHLSTIDVMLFGARLTGLYLAHAHGAAADGQFTVRALTIRAGRQPQEDGLDTFPVSGRHLSTVRADGIAVTTLECRIGLLTVRVEAGHHGSATALRGEGRYARAEELPGPWNTAPFGTSHHGRRQLLTAVEADVAGLTASAELALTGEAEVTGGAGGPADGSGGPSTGPGGPRATAIDLFVSALQLGQVLLYGLDGVDRATSNTLWMRRTSIEPVTGAGVVTGPGSDAGSGGSSSRFEVRLEEPRLLPSKQGTWRSADIVADLGGLRLRCSVAHLLPAQPAQPAPTAVPAQPAPSAVPAQPKSTR